MSNMFKQFQVSVNRGNILSAKYTVDAMTVSGNQKLLGPYNKSHWRFNKKNVEQAVHMECGGYVDKLTGVNHKLMQAARKQNPSGISVGSAIVTSSFNNFKQCTDEEQKKFAFVIHACAPWKTQENSHDEVKSLLTETYKNALRLGIKTRNIASVALPALGCGVNLVDPSVSALAAFHAISELDIEACSNNSIQQKTSNNNFDERLLRIDFWILDHLAHEAFTGVFGSSGTTKSH